MPSINGRVHFVAFVLLISGCAVSPGLRSLEPPADTGIVSTFDGSPAWVGGDALYLTTVAPDDLGHPQLVRASLSTRAMTPIAIPVPSDCQRVSPRQMGAIDGRLVFERICIAPPGHPLDGYHELVSFDDANSTFSVETRVAWAVGSFAKVAGTWLAAYGPDLCGWIDATDPANPPAGIGWPITVTDDGAPFAVNAGRNTHCDGTPIAAPIAAGPDGSLAFLASGAARSVAGGSRLRVPLNLYVREPAGPVRRLASGFVDPYVLAWDPAGSGLIVTAEVGGQQGLWHVAPSGRVERLMGGPVSGAAWSPDGSRIAVLVPERAPNVDQLLPPTRLLLLVYRPSSQP